jgi:prepilin-type N-terminal cleavage/methylation domain-containing protein
MTRTPRALQPGFTLVELLVVLGVVLAAIAILVPAVIGGLNKRPELETKVEIDELAKAMVDCRQGLGDIRYPLPSKLKLSEKLNYSNAGQAGTLDDDSFRVLNQMFGRHIWSNPNGWVDWNGDGKADPDRTLYGDQVMVFYLGGIPSASENACLGFADDPRDPSAKIDRRKGPYFAFDPGRLARDPVNGFFRYLDPYRTGAPYLYLASRKAANDYAATDCPPWAGQTVVQPYQSGKWFMKADSFQLLSAGRDGVFGPGGPWDPVTGYGSGPGVDDQANFSPNLLGKPAG